MQYWSSLPCQTTASSGRPKVPRQAARCLHARPGCIRLTSAPARPTSPTLLNDPSAAA